MTLISIIYTITSLIAAIVSFFYLGKTKGKEQEKHEKLEQDFKQFSKDINIKKEVDNMSFSDKSNFLLAKQQNNKN